MLTFITIVHVVLCVFMIFVILLQPGKDAGMGAALGGGAATSAFGGRGAVTFLSKVTAVSAVLFFLTSLGLSFVGMKTSVVTGAEEPSKAAEAVTTKPQGGTPIPAKAVEKTKPGTGEQTAPAPAPAGQPATTPMSLPATSTGAGASATPQSTPAAPAPAAPIPAGQSPAPTK